MSIRVMTQVWDKATRYSGGELLVLLALADWADDKGVCWPSVPQIAEKARLCDSQVYNVLRKLRDEQVIACVKPGGGRGKRTTYRVLTDNLPGIPVAKKPRNPANTVGFPGQENPPICASETLQSDTQKPSNLAESPTPPIRNNRQSTVTKATVTESSPTPSFDEVDPWKQILGELEKVINKQSFSTWLKPLRFDHIQGRTLHLRVPMAEFLHIGERYGEVIQRAIGELGLEVDRVVCEMPEPTASPPPVMFREPRYGKRNAREARR